MQEPNPKQLPAYVPELARTAFSLAISQMYDRRVYDDFPGKCQHCGSSNCVKNGHLETLFAKLISPKGSFVDVKVLLQRYVCKNCGGTYTSRGPFYDGATYGAPIVDIALALSMEHPAYAVERTLANFGIQMSTDAVLDYVRLFADRAKQLAPLIVGQGDGLYAINMLKILFGVDDARQLKEKLPGISVESLTDETYLRKKGALKKIVEEVLDGRKRIVHRGMKGDIVVDGNDGKASFPESFTLALSYLPGAEAYASLICTPQPFNQILADILFKALEGTSFNMTDGSHNYNGVKNHVLDPVHRTRTELRHDPKFRELKKELAEAAKKAGEADKKKVKAGSQQEEEKKQAAEEKARKLEEVTNYAKARYQEVLKSTLGQLRTEHPELFDERGQFRGKAVTSNGAEGGNWRVKSAVRVPYSRTDSAAGKSLLATIRDSVSTIRAGRAVESIANTIGAFTFGRVMIA
jgi:hypothetical protein